MKRWRPHRNPWTFPSYATRAAYGEHSITDSGSRRRMGPIDSAGAARMLRQTGEQQCQVKASLIPGALILPIHVHRSRAVAGYGVLVVRSVLPGHGSVCRDFDEFELHLRASGHGSIQEPIRIVG